MFDVRVKSRKKFKIGLIIDEPVVSSQTYDLVKLSMKSEYYEISRLILQRPIGKPRSLFHRAFRLLKKNGFTVLIRRIMFKLLIRTEQFVLERLSKSYNFSQKFDLNDFGIPIISVEPMVSESGLVYRYRETDLEKIRSENLDLLVRAGSGILRGGILNVCPKGIISFHHADNDVNRGGPPGFWEVYHKDDKTGFIIQILTDELDGGHVLFKGFITTSFVYSINLKNLYLKSNIFLHQTIEEMAQSDDSIYHYPKVPYYQKLFSTPSITQQLAYILVTFLLLIKKVFRRLCDYSIRWGVAYQFSETWNGVVLRRSKIIKNPPNRFYADPFLIHKDGKHYCFVEDYSIIDKRGQIAVIEICKNGYRELGTVLKERFHLSYPFIFEADGEMYMCPETHTVNEIRLYKCEEFPFVWKFQTVLIREVDAADTSIVYHQDKWWIFTNLCSAKIGDHGSELHIYSSTNLLSGEWLPHKKNPVIFDPSRARNGGLIIDGSDIYRVFQTQGFDTYGKSVGIAKILSLSQSDYEEEILSEIKPYFFSKLKGTHTFNYNSGLVVFDFSKVTKNKN